MLLKQATEAARLREALAAAEAARDAAIAKEQAQCDRVKTILGGLIRFQASATFNDCLSDIEQWLVDKARAREAQPA